MDLQKISCVVNKVVCTVQFSGPGVPGDYNSGIYCIFQDPGVPGCTVLKSFIYFVLIMTVSGLSLFQELDYKLFRNE